MVHLSPSVVICLAEIPYRYFRKVLLGLGGKERRVVKERVGWGENTYTQCHLALNGREILILRLPHLSRFCIIGRPESMLAVKQFTDIAAAYVRERA